MRQLFPELVNCPHCQATNPVAEERCQACRRPLTLYIGLSERLPRRIGLGALMLLIALIAVCLVVMREVPPLGVLLLLIVVPALLRTIQWAARRAADGQPMATIEKIGAFVASVALAWVLALVSGLAFGLICLLASFLTFPISSLFVPGNLWAAQQWAIGTAMLLGVLGAVFALYHRGRTLWAIPD